MTIQDYWNPESNSSSDIMYYTPNFAEISSGKLSITVPVPCTANAAAIDLIYALGAGKYTISTYIKRDSDAPMM